MEKCTYCGEELNRVGNKYVCPFCGQTYSESDIEYIHSLKVDR
jgi:predicted RNA-binding Zn-ribbon protein involved in translation (DUF1610 family)